jgi:hypothetical protein
VLSHNGMFSFYVVTFSFCITSCHSICFFVILTFSSIFVQDNIGKVNKMQWCKFVADRLHAELCLGKELDKECLFMMQVCILCTCVCLKFLNFRLCIFHLYLLLDK